MKKKNNVHLAKKTKGDIATLVLKNVLKLSFPQRDLDNVT